MNCTVASLTLPSLTSDERQRLLADESLRSLLTRVPNRASAMICLIC